MLYNIKPNKQKSDALTKKEKSLAKGLMNLGYNQQKLLFIINQGRSTLANNGRISEINKNKGIYSNYKTRNIRFCKETMLL